MNCDVGEATERLENEFDVGEVTERLENEQSSWLQSQQSSFSNLSITSPTSQLILELFHHFTYVTIHSPTLPSLYLRHSSFSNPSFASPTSQDLHLIHLASRPWFKYRTGIHKISLQTYQIIFFPKFVIQGASSSCVLPKGRSLTAKSGTEAEILPKGRSSIANSGTQVAVLLGMNRCGSFPLLYTPHSLFSI